MADAKVKGPASYFPSIEAKHGKPIEHWMKELKKVSAKAHMEQVAHLKMPTLLVPTSAGPLVLTRPNSAGRSSTMSKV